MLEKIPKVYSTYFLVVCGIWLLYVSSNNLFSLFEEHWSVSLTMLFGSLVAGASSEGGGAVAFPVFTLLLDISPDVARNFSFAIQSIGMTAASIMIIEMGIKVDKRAIAYASIGGGIGLIIGTFFLKGLIETAMLKLFFVSLWISFGFALFMANRNKKRKVLEKVTFANYKDGLRLLLFSFLGGLLTSFFGSGVDIFTFCLLTLYYNISESIATPTSVVIMTVITIIGFLLHVFVVQDFQPLAFEFWLCSIPIVIIFAPVGAYLITKVSRYTIFYFLLGVIIVQYIGAIFILQPSLSRMLFSIGVIFIGSLFFLALAQLAKNRALRLQTKTS